MLSYEIPIIMSTGMSTINQINQTMEIIGKKTIRLLHTTSSYPCPVNELNLKMIETQKTTVTILLDIQVMSQDW